MAKLMPHDPDLIRLVDAAHASEGYENLLRFVKAALRDERPARADWHDGVYGAVEELDRIVREGQPADVRRAQLAVEGLAALWLDLEETEAVYRGTSPTGRG